MEKLSQMLSDIHKRRAGTQTSGVPICPGVLADRVLIIVYQICSQSP